ncbi:MAG: NADPH:quinone reductase [Dehalococcoidia bacterium]
MRAAWYERVGAARDVLQVGEVETPAPGPGEVRVRLATSGVNPSDVKRRSGWRGQGMEYPRVIPHSDGAGVIDATGDGVLPSRTGERVWTVNASRGRPFGSAAEYVVLPSALAVPLPNGIDFAAGACLGIPARTAYHCLFADGPVNGQTILISGGAGAVGHAAVQLAVWGGATVISTVSSDAKAEYATAAGAVHVLNYRTEDVAARIRALTTGAGVDRVVEVALGSNLPINAAVIKINGVIAAYSSDREPEPKLPFSAFLTKNVTVHFILVYLLREAVRDQTAAGVNACLEAGKLHPVIAQRFPLEDIAVAHEAVESGQVTGNVVIDIMGG